MLAYNMRRAINILPWSGLAGSFVEGVKKARQIATMC